VKCSEYSLSWIMQGVNPAHRERQSVKGPKETMHKWSSTWNSPKHPFHWPVSCNKFGISVDLAFALAE